MRSGRFANRPDAQVGGEQGRRGLTSTGRGSPLSVPRCSQRGPPSGGCSRASHRFALPAFMALDTGLHWILRALPRNRSILTFRQQLPQRSRGRGMVVGVLDADPAVEAFLAQDA